jgi:uncharacterized membrane protein YhaH (DUF805 family)
MSTIEVMSRLVTGVVFFGAGYLLSRRFHPPQRNIVWAVLILVVFMASYIGVNTILLSIFGLAIYVDTLLEAIGFGLVAGLLTQRKM